MIQFGITIDIGASPDRVWAVLCDVERWPEWTASVAGVQRLDAGPLAVGSRARILQPNLGPAVWRVTELDECAKVFTWATRSMGVKVAGRHEVIPNDAGCRVALSLQFSGLLGPLIARFYRSLNQSYLATEANGLKRRSEA